MGIRSQTRGVRATVAILCTGLTLGACAPQFSTHGYIPPAEDLALIEVGSDTKDTVAEKIGVPQSSGVLTNSGYYYVKMRKRSIGPLAPEEVEREVLAISFSDNGVVQNVERFGLERGRVVPLERRVTSSPVSDNTFIRQLLGNLGRFRPAGLGG
jgi:outer membrane protein assembly factor BamE (lipoprotein component of BamABCDE complex)